MPENPAYPEFVGFPKIARYSREVIVTEKLDGTNAQVYIVPTEVQNPLDSLAVKDGLALYAGSRKRWLNLGADNHGFARWCFDHADELFALGQGRHFGEWWGSGINRGYGLPKGEKRLSLFNVVRWCLAGEPPQRIITGDLTQEKYQDVLPPCVGLVPVLGRCDFDYFSATGYLSLLQEHGSVAAPGFMQPEGIVVWHLAGNVGFKKTLVGDDEHKLRSKRLPGG